MTNTLISLCNINPRLRYFLHTLVAFALAMQMGCDAVTEKPLRVATLPWPGYESVHLAQSLGYFDPAAIRIVEMANASQSSMAIRNGTVDASLLTLDEALNLMQDGIDLRVVLVMDISNGADVVMARPSIPNLQALRGKRVAAENSAVGAIMLDAMLETSGLKISDITLIGKPVNEHAEAYEKNEVDAVVTFEPVRTLLQKQGARVLFDSSQIPGRIIDALIVRTEAMSQHPQALKALIAAHFKALDYQTTQPLDAAKRIAPFLGVKVDEVLAQYKGLQLPTLADNHAWLTGTPPPIQATTAKLADLMLQRKLLQHSVNVEHLAEPVFLPQ